MFFTIFCLFRRIAIKGSGSSAIDETLVANSTPKATALATICEIWFLLNDYRQNQNRPEPTVDRDIATVPTSPT